MRNSTTLLQQKTELTQLQLLLATKQIQNKFTHQKMWSAASLRPMSWELTESNRNLRISGHWLLPSSSRDKNRRHQFASTPLGVVKPSYRPTKSQLTDEIASELCGDVADLLADVGGTVGLDSSEQLCLDGRLHVNGQAGIDLVKRRGQQTPQQHSCHLLNLWRRIWEL